MINTHYKKYCKMLRNVLNEAKKQYFHNKIATSTNKIKTAWKIIKRNSGDQQKLNAITEIYYKDEGLTNINDTEHAFDQYYTKEIANINTSQSDMLTALSLLSNNKIENPAQMKIIQVTEAKSNNKNTQIQKLNRI